jgi:ribonuclease D
MNVITTSDGLAAACAAARRGPYVTVDTEFIRETTFWPELCLIQIAWPDGEAIVDPLSPSLDLAPFFHLMADEKVVKVFHAARQDIEIVFHLGGLIPHPVFDTQVAAMVCGYGDSISYDQLAQRICGVAIDKSLRFTDWKRRPLTQKQLEYALADVTHLRAIYQSIKANLEEQGRATWVAEEMETLTSRETYDLKPADAWRRLKLRVRRPREFALMKELARWREETARRMNLPRGRILKDEAIYEICGHPPANAQELADLRGLARGFDRGRHGADILAIVAAVAKLPKGELPAVPAWRPPNDGNGAAAEMLKVLLRIVVERHGVAAKVIATVDDLEQIAGDDNADVPALSGWRRELFGEQALALKAGRIALGFDGRRIAILPVDISGERLDRAAE